MIERLQEYVYGNPSPRRVRDGISLIVSFGWFLVAISLGFTPWATLIQSITVLVAFQAGTTWWYCRRPPQDVETAIRAQRVGMITAFGFASLLVVILLSGPRVEAAVIAERFRRILRNPNPDSLKTAASLLSVANSDRLILPKGQIQQLVAHRLTIDDVRIAVLDNVNREATARGIPLPLLGLVISKDSPVGEVSIYGVSAEGTNLERFHVDPRAGSLVPPDMVGFLAPIGKPVPTKSGGAYVRINGSHGVVIPLDDMQCKNVMFVNCTLVYSGGSLKLENSGFFNSTFRFAENQSCQRLAEEILKNPAITLSI